jgi:hypothetical protein
MIIAEMVNGKIKYEFTAEVWQYSGPGGWFFVSVEHKISQEIRENLQWQEEGWGRLKATAKIGNSTWLAFMLKNRAIKKLRFKRLFLKKKRNGKRI